MLLRCSAGQGAYLLVNAANALLPLFLQSIIFQTSTFWVALFAYLLKNEKPLSVELFSLVVCFSCVVFISVSGMVSSPTPTEELASSDGAVETLSILGLVLSVLGSFVHATTCYSNQFLQEVPASIIIFWLSATGVLFSILMIAAPALALGTPVTLFSYSGETFAFMGFAALVNCGWSNLFTLSYQSGPVALVSLLSYVSVVHALFADLLVFNETLSVAQLAGASTMMATILATSLYKMKLDSAKAQSAATETARTDMETSFTSFISAKSKRR